MRRLGAGLDTAVECTHARVGCGMSSSLNLFLDAICMYILFDFF
jgi:hypothetical protein